MAKTVNAAFDSFMANIVNLDPDITKTAKSSRDWLVDQITSLPTKVSGFPSLVKANNSYFGSFDRKTKKRELDDIDIIIALHADGCSHNYYGSRVELTVSSNSTTIKNYCHDNINTVNSRKIINAFVSALSNIGHYKKAEIHRTQEAATLNLVSYDWCFDIVPAFFTSPDYYGKTYFLIPDGQGHWKKTDPRIDKARATTINQKHDGNVLKVIRAMKFWNKRATMPSMGSYLLENMILDYYAAKTDKASSYVDVEVISVLWQIYSAVFNPVYDPKGIQGDLNSLSYADKKKISDRAYLDYMRGKEARGYEDKNEHEAAIKKWIEVFGSSFPKYG